MTGIFMRLFYHFCNKMIIFISVYKSEEIKSNTTGDLSNAVSKLEGNSFEFMFSSTSKYHNYFLKIFISHKMDLFSELKKR